LWKVPTAASILHLFIRRKLETIVPFDHLPTETRLMALGLPIPDKNPGGRLSFRERMEIGIRVREVHDSFARFGRSTRHPRLDPVLKKVRGLLANNNVGGAARLSKEADALGRYHQIPILKPAVPLPEIDRIVAQERGITARKVRTVREDNRIAELVGLPLWKPKDWLERARLCRRAKPLVTPAYLAKVDRGEIVLGESFGALAVLDELGQASLTPGQRFKALELQRRCYAGGLGHLALGYLVGPGSWVNVMLPKVLSQADYNQHIVDCIGLSGLKFLRAILHEGASLLDLGYQLGAWSPEEARRLASAILRKLLDRI
jgi:hypothetical protein